MKFLEFAFDKMMEKRNRAASFKEEISVLKTMVRKKILSTFFYMFEFILRENCISLNHDDD